KTGAVHVDLIASSVVQHLAGLLDATATAYGATPGARDAQSTPVRRAWAPPEPRSRDRVRAAWRKRGPRSVRTPVALAAAGGPVARTVPPVSCAKPACVRRRRHMARKAF